MKPDWFEIFSIIAFPVCFFWLLKIVYDDGKESGIEQLKADLQTYQKLSAEQTAKLIIAKGEIEQLKSKLEVAKKGLEEALIKVAYVDE